MRKDNPRPDEIECAAISSFCLQTKIIKDEKFAAHLRHVPNVSVNDVLSMESLIRSAVKLEKNPILSSLDFLDVFYTLFQCTATQLGLLEFFDQHINIKLLEKVLVSIIVNQEIFEIPSSEQAIMALLMQLQEGAQKAGDPELTDKFQAFIHYASYFGQITETSAYEAFAWIKNTLSNIEMHCKTF